MRIYKVSLKDVAGNPRNENEVLVRAGTKAAALRFVAEKTLGIEVASQDDLFRLAKSGGEVEEAKSEPEEKAPAKDGPAPKAKKHAVAA